MKPDDFNDRLNRAVVELRAHPERLYLGSSEAARLVMNALEDVCGVKAESELIEAFEFVN